MPARVPGSPSLARAPASASFRHARPSARVGGQFCAPPKPFIASVMPAGLSTICEKRTTVTVSSGETVRP